MTSPCLRLCQRHDLMIALLSKTGSRHFTTGVMLTCQMVLAAVIPLLSVMWLHDSKAKATAVSLECSVQNHCWCSSLEFLVLKLSPIQMHNDMLCCVTDSGPVQSRLRPTLAEQISAALLTDLLLLLQVKQQRCCRCWVLCSGSAQPS